MIQLFQFIDGPPLRVQLHKKGHSSEVERQQLMTEALGYYRLQGKILLADREYVGENRTAEAVASLSLFRGHRLCHST